MSAPSKPQLHFPVSAAVPQTSHHLRLKTTLHDSLCEAFSAVACIGCGQFVYWDASDPSVCLAPDAIVKLGRPDDLFDCWRVWERGVPEVAVEIVCEVDERDRDWDANLERFRSLGVGELIRFDPEQPGGSLRAWDRVGQELVERSGVEWSTPSRYLNGYWVVLQDAKGRPVLRLSHDQHGRQLFPTKLEALRQETEALRQETEALRQETEALRQRKPSSKLFS
ncbi:MAG TPA: Uma2 family endonuclease [Polyangiaceae bacterium]|jgi:hypothetical protein